MRARVVGIVLALVAITAGLFLVPKGYDRVTQRPPTAALGAARAIGLSVASAIKALPKPILKAGPVAVDTPGFWAWALLDRKKNELSGSPNMTQTNSTESMIKVWIVSDTMRRATEAGKEPTKRQQDQASVAIRDSNDSATQSLYVAGGGDAMINRLIQTCGLTETKVFRGRWANTQMSARDAIRMGLCVADGRAAGPKWTPWVLSEMRQVRGGIKDQTPDFTGTGGGRWGIIDGLPAEVAPNVSIKNGWTPIGADNSWHLNCLAVHEEFVLAVQARYPVSLGLEHGAGICRGVAEQLVHNAQTR